MIIIYQSYKYVLINYIINLNIIMNDNYIYYLFKINYFIIDLNFLNY